jgi:acyl carrier protein
MNEKTTYETLMRILSMELNISDPVDSTTSLLADNILDSMEFMHYLSIVEREFAVEISDDAVAERKLGNIANMVAFLTEPSGT